MLQVTLDEDSLKQAIRMYLEKRIVGAEAAKIEVSFTVPRTEGKGTSATVSMEFENTPVAQPSTLIRSTQMDLPLDE